MVFHNFNSTVHDRGLCFHFQCLSQSLSSDNKAFTAEVFASLVIPGYLVSFKAVVNGIVHVTSFSEFVVHT